MALLVSSAAFLPRQSYGSLDLFRFPYAHGSELAVAALRDVLIRGKGDDFDRVALTAEVAACLTSYIENDRPPAKSTCLFVDHKAPFPPLEGGAQLHRELIDTFKRAGVDMPARTGSRVIRHTFATQLVREGKSIAEVANLLRHRRLNTTMIYARTDLKKRLRDVAQP